MNILNKKKSGALAFEFILEFPTMVFCLLIMLYFMLICVTNISLNNTANNLAQDFNMRQSGFNDTYQSNEPKIETENMTHEIKNYGPLFPSFEFTDSDPKIADIYINGNQSDCNKVIHAGYYFIENRKDSLEGLPGVGINSIDISVKDVKGFFLTDSSISKGSNGLMGSNIKVTINYTILGFQFRATGYNVIC